MPLCLLSLSIVSLFCQCMCLSHAALLFSSFSVRFARVPFVHFAFLFPFSHLGLHQVKLQKHSRASSSSSSSLHACRHHSSNSYFELCFRTWPAQDRILQESFFKLISPFLLSFCGVASGRQCLPPVISHRHQLMFSNVSFILHTFSTAISSSAFWHYPPTRISLFYSYSSSEIHTFLDYNHNIARVNI